MKKVAIVLCTLALVACGDSSKIQDAVREQLKDPGSANFKEAVVSKNGKRACIVWNAKNSMGGYGDWQVAELTKGDSGWKVDEMKGLEQNCTDAGFQSMDAAAISKRDAYEKAIGLLQKARNISHADAIALAQKGACESLIRNYSIVAELMGRWKDPDMQKEYAEKLKKFEIGLADGSCQEH